MSVCLFVCLQPCNCVDHFKERHSSWSISVEFQNNWDGMPNLFTGYSLCYDKYDIEIVYDLVTEKWFTGYARFFQYKTKLAACVYEYVIENVLQSLYPLCETLVRPYAIYRPSFESPNEFYEIKSYTELTSAITDVDLQEFFEQFCNFSNKTASKVFHLVFHWCHTYEYRFEKIVSMYFTPVCNCCRTFTCYSCLKHRFNTFCNIFFQKYTFEMTYTHVYFVLILACHLHEPWKNSEKGERLVRSFVKCIYSNIKSFLARNRIPNELDVKLFNLLLDREFPCAKKHPDEYELDEID